jgi:hypothetical protein
MSCVLNWYRDRLEPITFANVTDNVEHTANVLVQRRGKTITASTVNDAKVFMCDLDLPLYNGALITRQKDGKRYIVIARQYSTDMLHIQGRRVNGLVQLSTIENITENHRKVGEREIVKAKDAPVYWRDVMDYMRSYDAGLLPQTRRKMLMRKDIPVEMHQRVVFASTDSVVGQTTPYKSDVYTVESIDGAKYEGLNEIQLGTDTRGSKG